MKGKTSYLFLAQGVEEIEALATADAMRRAHIQVVCVATGDSLKVQGSMGLNLMADVMIDDVDFSDADWLIVPGGSPGAQNLHESEKVNEVIREHYERGGRIASICAGPAVVLAPLGVLKGKKATCYPGLGDAIEDGGGTYVNQRVAVEPKLITSEGPGTTLDFAMEIIRETKGDKMADGIAESMLVAR